MKKEIYFNKVRNRLLKFNKNWIAIICGETGSAKSYSAMSIAEILTHGTFSPKKHIVFDSEQLLELINNPENLKKGDIIIFDEAGVGMNARNWHSVQNIVLGSVLQTFRNLNVGLIFTTPNLSFLDNQGRKLIHSYFQTKSIDRVRKLSIVKVFDVQVNSRLDKIYYKNPKFVVKGILKTMIGIKLPKINARKSKQYELMKLEYTTKINKEALETIKEINIPQTNGKDIEAKALISLQADYKQYLRRVGKREYLDIDLIQRDYNLTVRQAKRIKKTVEETFAQV